MFDLNVLMLIFFNFWYDIDLLEIDGFGKWIKYLIKKWFERGKVVLIGFKIKLLVDWVMMRFKICLKICVGIEICCERLKVFNNLLNVIVFLLCIKFMWKLKFLVIIRGLGYMIMFLRYDENLLKNIDVEELGGW